MCGQPVDDVEHTAHAKNQVTCDACHRKILQVWSIKDCKRCGNEFAFVVGSDREGPTRCRPCRHELDAKKAERAAAKHRAQIEPARIARDNQVARVKKRGWATRKSA